MKEFNFIDVCGHVDQECDPRELCTLDKDSPTSINDFIDIFAHNRSFAPPEGVFIFDSDLGEIDIDSDISPSMDYDFEEAFEDDEKRARAQS